MLGLLKPGGQIIILDGNQKRLRHSNWLIKLFREPYSQVYAAENIDTWMKDLGFKKVQTDYVGWISQITTGFKIELEYRDRLTSISTCSNQYFILLPPEYFHSA